MTSKEVMYSTYQAARYVAQRGIPGDLVECGVWRGGSALLAALTVQQTANAAAPYKRRWFGRPNKKRQFWLYDTFEGMTRPTERDVDLDGFAAATYMNTYADDGKWCYADESDVRQVFSSNGIAGDDIRLVKGDVVQTLQRQKPSQIALLRLDTDWYESTKSELEILYPLLSPGGVLIIDDYGHWEGARVAVDEYFSKHPSVLLNRISYAVRVAIKP
jgi:O-methyltransferase